MENFNNILLITTEFPPQPGGIGNHAFHLANSLQKEGKRMTVVTEYRSKEGIEEDTFDNGLNFPVSRVRRNTWLWITYWKRIRVAYRMAKSVDLIIVSGKFSLWTGGVLSFFLKRKYMAVIHGSEVQLKNGLLRKFTNFCLRQFHTVVPVSNYTASLVAPLSLERLVVINNGFDSVHTTLQEPKSKKGLRLITVGNLTRRKGQHNVIAALPKLIEKFPEAHYDLIGIPTEKEHLEALATNLGVEKALTFHGNISQERKIQLLKESSIFAMLSESTEAGHVEGFGIAILEANALGVPAIGSLGCGIEDAIDSGKSGYLVNPKDTDEIVAKVAQVMVEYPIFSQHAQQWSRAFTWETIIKQYLTLMHSS